MISRDLARRLRDAGLEWIPREGDRFVIPDRGLDDKIFSISEMTVDVTEGIGGRRISFNGAVEWALDSIMDREVIWLPTEAQLRDRLGLAFQSLERVDGGYRCHVRLGDWVDSYESAHPSEAYGLALLAIYEDQDLLLELLVS